MCGSRVNVSPLQMVINIINLQWNARYSFPSQSTKAEKLTPRIPPKNGGAFGPGQVIRVEFPAQVRALTEWTAVSPKGTVDQGSIADGIGGSIIDSTFNNANGDGANPAIFGLTNVRQKHIQGAGNSLPPLGGAFAYANFAYGATFNGVGSTDYPPGFQALNGIQGYTRRYQVNFALGLFTQDKLIPVKFMASQLAIEITLEQAQGCMFTPPSTVAGYTSTSPSFTIPAPVAANGFAIGPPQTYTSSTTPTYGVGNVNLIPEIMQFDASYDEMFLQGLRDGGVPIKFSSWHTFIFSTSASASVNLLVQERSRSVKALFAVQKRPTTSYAYDSGASFFDTSFQTTGSGLTAISGTLQQFQWRIGGRYFPAQPVQCCVNSGSSIGNGGAEAYLELAKALNIVGDSRLSTNTSTMTWALPILNFPTVPQGYLSEYDGAITITEYVNGYIPIAFNIEAGYAAAYTSASCSGFSGGLPSQQFAMATSLETSNGIEISGLNAEEQSDIALIANWKNPQVLGQSSTPANIEVYSYYDAMLILRENNVLELIQ